MKKWELEYYLTNKWVFLIIALVVVVAVGFFLIQPFNTPSKTKIYEVVAVAGQGGLVNGSKKLSVLLPENSKHVVFVAEPEIGYKFVGWFRDGELICENESIVLVPENVTLLAKFRRIKVAVVFEANVTGAEVYINFKKYVLPTTLVFDYGEVVTVKALSFDHYVLLNGTGYVFRAEKNQTVKFFYRINETRVYEPVNISHICIVSNIGNATVLVDGVNRTTPYCFKTAYMPVEIEGKWEIPYNETHSWWLGWYWVEEGNKTWWWSYGLNGSRLYLSKSANVTLHYVLGLKELPYVVEVWNYTPIEYYVQRSYTYTFEDYGIKLIPTGRHRYFNTMTLLELPGEFGLVEVEVRFGARRMNPEYVFSLGIIWLDGDKFANLPTLGISPNPHGPTVVLLNGTVAKMAWLARQNWTNRYSLHYTGDDPYMDIFCNNPSYWYTGETSYTRAGRRG